MSQVVIWILGMGVSTAMLIVTAALKAQYIHMSLAAAIAVLMALAAVGEQRRMVGQGAKTAMVAGVTMRNLGLIWTWGALNLVFSYGFVLTWSHWLKAFVVCLIVGGLCLFLAAMLAAEAKRTTPDENLQRIARAIATSHLIIMAVALVALGLETVVWKTVDVGQQRWVATHFMLFGSLALTAISLNGLLSEAGLTEAGPKTA